MSRQGLKVAQAALELKRRVGRTWLRETRAVANLGRREDTPEWDLPLVAYDQSRVNTERSGPLVKLGTA